MGNGPACWELEPQRRVHRPRPRATVSDLLQGTWGSWGCLPSRDPRDKKGGASVLALPVGV